MTPPPTGTSAVLTVVAGAPGDAAPGDPAPEDPAPLDPAVEDPAGGFVGSRGRSVGVEQAVSGTAVAMAARPPIDRRRRRPRGELFNEVMVEV